MYNSSYSNSGYPNTYQYPPGYAASGYTYQDYGQQYQTQASQPVPSGEGTYQSEGNWNSSGYGSTAKDAVAQEMQQQKAQLVKQREDYVKKVSVLRHELEQLRLQKQDLMVDEKGSNRDLANILKENDKLQEEIQGKMKAIQNVIEMLSSIIKDGKSMSDLEADLELEKAASKQGLGAPNYHSEAGTKNRSTTPEPAAGRYNYVHYDTGLHWCRLCDNFPETAKDFLLHLQDKKHKDLAKESDIDNTPWHKVSSEPILPSYDDAPTKRIPIKGLQFFISAPSWYCKLCDVWIGDLHCASHHLKSQIHFQNYENFVSQNSHWEMEWLTDREKAMERKGVNNSSDDSDTRKSKKKKKDKRHSAELAANNKKKKKRSKKRRKRSSDSSSSSSSSDSSSDDDDKTDRSKSIRVAMRNVKQFQAIMEEDLTGKWSVLEKLVEEHKKKQEDMTEKVEKEKKDQEKAKEQEEDPLINQWMTVSHTQDKDRALLDSLKDRMRKKQEHERIKQVEMEKRRQEKEKEEQEMLKRRQQEEREAAEEAERERKRREQEESDRIRDKDRNQVRFRTSYRRRRSLSKSDDEDNRDKYYAEERQREARERSRRDSERSSSARSRDARSRSQSTERKIEESGNNKKKPPGPPSYKKLPFIGRMPLFKNKKPHDDKEEKKEIQKESYDSPRRTRFEPGNLPRAFMPRPDVVCFPKLSSIPPLSFPPAPPTISNEKVEVPAPPKIEEPPPPPPPPPPKTKELEPPPPPKLEAHQQNLSDDEVLYGNSGEEMNPSMMGQYYQEYANMMYSQDMYYNESVPPAPPPPSIASHSHILPLEPPPLPPDDDLAMLGICADDMAAQSF